MYNGSPNFRYFELLICSGILNYSKYLNILIYIYFARQCLTPMRLKSAMFLPIICTRQCLTPLNRQIWANRCTFSVGCVQPSQGECDTGGHPRAGRISLQMTTPCAMQGHAAADLGRGGGRCHRALLPDLDCAVPSTRVPGTILRPSFSKNQRYYELNRDISRGHS